MNNNKLETISNLFEGKEIRSVWDSEKEEYYFSVVDIIGVSPSGKATGSDPVIPVFESQYPSQKEELSKESSSFLIF